MVRFPGKKIDLVRNPGNKVDLLETHLSPTKHVQSKVGVMAASSSKGDSGGGGADQWWTRTSGWWHHPSYGSYQDHGNYGYDFAKGGNYGNTKGNWSYYGPWEGSSQDAAWDVNSSDLQVVWQAGDAESHDGGTGGLTSSTTTRAMPVGATPKKRAKASDADGGDVGTTETASSCIPFSAVNRLANRPIDLDADWEGTTEEIDESWEGETEAVVEAKKLFWVPERESRLRNAGLTCFEKHQLLESYPLMLDDMKKVINMFGVYKGPTRAARTMLKHIAGAKSMVCGQEAEYDTPEFSICKHLLVASWKGLHEDVATMGFEKCCCFPRTSLMLMGCRHHKKALWNVPFYMHTLCKNCSTCLRCGGLLGFITH